MKTVRILFVFMVATIFLLTACGGAAPAEPAPQAEQPPAAEPPTAEPAPAEPAQPAEPAPPEPTQPQYAPMCQAAPATCEAPTVEMLDNKYCIEKVPYAIMSVPAGTTYESLDPDMVCVDQMHSDGSLRVTCHSVTSKALISYDLKLTMALAALLLCRWEPVNARKVMVTTLPASAVLRLPPPVAMAAPHIRLILALALIHSK